ncbi:MAG: ABC transporter ATP-binding protein [Actinomycetales bacterium]
MSSSSDSIVTPMVPAQASAPAAGAGAGAPSAVAAEVRDARKVYGSGDAAVVALDGVSVQIEQGSFVAIMGPSGSGKSTLLHCLAGLDTLTAGQVLIGGTDLGSLSDKQLTLLRRDRLGFVFQAFNLLPTLTAEENIRLPLDLAGRKADAAWVASVVDTLGLRERLHHRPTELSGGQQQRVAVARALATRPELILADEPTGALDSRTGAELLGFLRRAVDDLGQTVVMVTHDAVAASYADRILFLADGQVVGELADPTAEQVLDAMKRLERLDRQADRQGE